MKLTRNQKGAALLEFAIVLPLVSILLCGMVEFGLLYYNKQVITNASREGARAGIVLTIQESEVRTIVKNYANNRLIGLKTAMTIGDGDINITKSGSDVRVAVTVPYQFLTSQIIGTGASVNISGITVMREENAS